MSEDSAALPPRRPEYSTRELVRRLLALAWRFKLDCVLSIAMSMALLGLALFGLQLLGLIVDVIRHAVDPSIAPPVFPFRWAPPSGWGPLETVTVLSCGILLQAGLRAYLTYEYNMVTARLSQAKIVPELRDRIYDKLQRLSFRFHEAQGVSSMFNRVTGDVQNTRLFIDGVVLQGINMLLTLVAYMAFMWWIHPGLTLACLSTTLGLYWLTTYYSKRLRPAYHRNRELYDDLVLVFGESVRGMQTVKGFAAEQARRDRFEEANRLVSEQQKSIFMDLSVFTPATQFLSQASLVILFAYGGWLYVRGELALGAGLVVFAGLLQQFNGQVANVTTIANSVQQSFTAAKRVFEVLDAEIEVKNGPSPKVPQRLSGAIAFEHVTFGYSDEEPVLKDISFETSSGQIIGVFGMTGAG